MRDIRVFAAVARRPGNIPTHCVDWLDQTQAVIHNTMRSLRSPALSLRLIRESEQHELN